MKILCLGTGAADFLPSLKDKNRFVIDKNIRRCTATLIDEKLLVDCGPHLIDEIKIHNVDATKIKNVLITHNHSDHCNVDNLTALVELAEGEIDVWHGPEFDLPEIKGITYHKMTLFEEYSVDGYSITAVPSNHAAGAVHYSINGDKKLFYGCDGAWILFYTFRFMWQQNYDAMIIDATVGDYDGDFRMAEHNSIPMIRMMMASFKTKNVVKDDTKIILDHLARTLHKSYEETCEIVKDDNYIVAFDGMEMEI